MGKKTDVETQEAIFAAYVKIQSYAEVARQFGMPETTVFAICKRLGGDELAEKRTAMRELLADEMWEKVRDLVRVVTKESLEGGSMPSGFAAAKALESIGKVAHLLAPKEKEDAVAPTEIHIHGDIRPPTLEEKQPSPMGEGTTSTVGKE